MTTSARDYAAFETFYRDVRGRLLLQTWALTGDLSAAQKAVRDAFTVASHHWRKLRRLPDSEREDWVRPLAWQRAQRRHSVPHLHRDRDIDPEIRATLAALVKLPILSRRVLLLARLASVNPDTLAREVGVPKPRTELLLQSATEQFAQLRQVQPDALRHVFEPMAAYAAERQWPRATVISRAGAARRRTHTLAGVVAGCAALVVSGLFVSQAATTSPSLESLSLHGSATATPTAPVDVHYPLHPDQLLTDSAVSDGLPGTWTTQLTSDSGTASLPCAASASADAHPDASLVRTFTGPKKNDLVAESVTASTSVTNAQAAYTTTLGWAAGCTLPRLQLVDTQRLAGVGDEATLVGLRDWSRPTRSLVIGVVRSGTLTTAVAASLPRNAKAGLHLVTALLRQAQAPVCALPGAGACVGTPKARDVAPLPIGSDPGLLDAVDLPPASNVNQPWAATAPQAATTNPAASHCDQTDFDTSVVTGDLTRTFLVTKDSPGVRFGMSQTVGLLHSSQRATRFVAAIEKRLTSCFKRELGSKATPMTSPKPVGGSTISLWRVDVGSEHDTTTYLMALVRRGRAVSQLSFIPAGKATIAPAAFTALAERAADRLAYLTS